MLISMSEASGQYLSIRDRIELITELEVNVAELLWQSGLLSLNESVIISYGPNGET